MSIPTATKRRRTPIRVSTRADLEAIHRWLEHEHATGVPDNFLRHWKLAVRAHQEHRLLVYVDPPSGVPVGYEWGGLLQPGVLEVRRDMRRRGIGRQLVEHRMAQARRKDQGLLYIECTPPTSIPFWRAMGFTALPASDEGHRYAYRILEKTHVLPRGGHPIDVAIRFFPEAVVWEPTTEPLGCETPQALLYPDATIRLAKRVYLFERLYPEARDPVVEIAVEGQVRYRDKAKRDDAERLGVARCSNGFFLDRIHTVAWR